MIGLIGAMAEEVSLFKENMEDIRSLNYARMDYMTGYLKEQNVVLLQSGIGKVNATIGTQIMIDRFEVDQIIFTGLAGTLVPHLTRGDVVVSNYVVQDVGRMIEADPRMVKLACYAFDDNFKYMKGSPQLVVGTIASGDRFVSDPRKIEWLQREFGAVATEMEGAAVGYACHLNEVPFVILRTISDTAGSDAKDEFESYLKDACNNSFRIVSSILEAVSHKASAC